MTLPKKAIVPTTSDDDLLNDWLKKNPEFTTKELEVYLDKSKATVRKIIADLLEKHKVIRIGNGPSTRYVVKH